MDFPRILPPRVATTATSCTPYTITSNGVLSIPGADPTTLTADAVYSPLCTATALAQPAIIANGGFDLDQTTSASNPQFSDLRDPFYASIFPQCYALAATTVLAYLLLIMLFIAPRSFLDGGVVVLGRRGFTNGPSNGISIGGRPWLQKVAALTVAISLTIATADTFRVAEEQYAWGIQNAQQLQEDVLGGTQLKVIQLISDTFLWLAQAQTLIRLFPRQREKVIIKWTAFSLITLDVIFGALNSFHYTKQGNTRPRSFTDAVPALSYLFQLSLGLLYAAWVLYYSLMKKRYAFYHPLMKNICLMATLSIISILVPVVFFVLDIAEPEFTGWGDYVRWVGAAAASVVVWEWVERIEALEREEKKDGVLGREVFDGDEMMEVFPSDLSWPRRRKNKKKSDEEEFDEGDSGNSSSFGGRSNMWPAMSSIASRVRSRSESSPDRRQQGLSTARSATRFLQPPLWPSRPPPAVTPVSRTDTASADSTVYAVRYQPLTETTTRTTDDRHGRPLSRSNSATSSASGPASDSNGQTGSTPPPQHPPPAPEPEKKETNTGLWHQLNPFSRAAREPPAEVLPHTIPKSPTQRRDYDSVGRWDLRGRMEIFTATQAERILERIRPTPDTDSLPVTVIPAPPRRGAALAQLLEEEELQIESHEHSAPSTSLHSSRPMRTPSIATGSMPPPHHGIRDNSMTSSTSRQTPSPAERSDLSSRRPPITRDGNSLTTSTHRSGDQRERMASERRPVDDTVRNERSPTSPPA
ncbi:pH-response regulator protein palH/rim-21 [Annulohypoxylon maeteangense]|uniref:pH-response regulator protein palH/rim-21 n=1 Tax=Annulohypoxylon maeteangense TaxID=1927788 RepID=UPI002008A00E|nr:pH-response regulator protein palH/rim-21 [Annulohypoxylon maeteangense]KAI0883407.1 pH-response regulator protein palH/rim-21 [Annulohypoxylon maeteangense]